jgi:GH25 family lysozyme M1 (1,4-beta-N-acetylmuramidase)
VYVDISSNNGTPNLPAYKAAGHTDLMLKATQGNFDYYWPQMATLAQQWHSFGSNYRVGYYHWLYANQPAQSQFSFFWSHVAPVWRAGDWLMTDFEDVDPSRWVSDSQHVAVLRGFNDLCRARGPIHTYTGNWFLNNLPQCAAYLRSQPVVMSDYTNTPPANPYGLSYVAHQFTSSASVAGFAGRVDYNRWLLESTSGGGVPINEGPEVEMLDPNDPLVKQLLAQTATANSGVTVAGQQLEHNDILNTLKLAGDAVALLSDPSKGVVVQLAVVKKAVADLAAAVAALQAASGGGSIAGHTINLTGSIQ